jgi:hypothetical protein
MLRNLRPCAMRNVSPTVQFGTAVRKADGVENLAVRIDEKDLKHSA